MRYEDAKRLSKLVQKYDELGSLYEAIKEDRSTFINKVAGDFLYTTSYLAINTHGESLSYEFDANLAADILKKIGEAICEKRGEYFHAINTFKEGETE